MYPILARFIDQQTWLDTVADPLQKAIGSLFAAGGEDTKRLKNALNGVWLGHPLHPVLTDVPVGAWVTTAVLDTAASMTDDDGLANASDLSLAVGLAGAIGSAVTGWTDWSDTYGRERTVGLFHGLTMAATILCYTASLAARRGGARGAGVAMANTGLALLTAGAYVGGDEVYDLGYGVNHTAFEHGPGSFAPAMPEADLDSNAPTKAEAGGVPIVLVRQEGRIYALDDTCVHAGCSLAGGRLEGRSIICPCHGSQFDLHDGSVINGPATMPEPVYDVRVENGTIEVRQARH